MCGIFGIISQKGFPFEWVIQLGELNKRRGNLAFGGVIWQPSEHQVFRFSSPFDATKIDTNQATVLLCHIRAPTAGQSADIREVHPFETTDLLLAHNGILLNHTRFPTWRIQSDLAVDSQVIAGGIQSHLNQKYQLPIAITKTVSQLNGQQGCWLWSKGEPSLYLWRVMSSLYYTHQSDCFVFSSVQSELSKNLMPEGVIYQINPNTLQFSQKGTFPFYSPYKIVYRG